MDHRLLAVHILARLHRVHRSLLVPVVRRRDNHRIDVLTRQHLPVVARRKHVPAPQLLAPRQPAVVAVRHRHQPHSRHLQRDLRVPLALYARADQRNLDLVPTPAHLRFTVGKRLERMQSRPGHRGPRCHQKRSTIHFRHLGNTSSLGFSGACAARERYVIAPLLSSHLASISLTIEA